MTDYLTSGSLPYGAHAEVYLERGWNAKFPKCFEWTFLCAKWSEVSSDRTSHLNTQYVLFSGDTSKMWGNIQFSHAEVAPWLVAL